MARLLAIHLTAIAVLAGVTVYALDTVGEALPNTNRWLVIGLTSAYGVYWLAVVLLRLRPGAVGLRHHNRALALGGSLVIAANTFLVGPYAPERLQLISILYQMGAVTMQVMGSIRRGPGPRRLSLEPLIIPASIALFYAVYWSPISPALIVFALAYGFVAVSLAQVLQRSVDRAYAGREAAERARDAKARFLASASHDLGQPLQAARLFFEKVVRTRDGRARRDAIEKVEWAFDSMEQLLNQMLDHLKLETGAVRPRLGRVAVGPLIARIAEVNEPAARLAGVEILALPTRLETVADAQLAERALGNLVGNSIRHAKARRVLVGARRRAGRVRLWVIDDGIGIPEADAPGLFEDFVQGSDHGDEIRGGFGLGLASARRMADLMGAGVGYEQKWSKGSAFWLEFPAATANSG